MSQNRKFAVALALIQAQEAARLQRVFAPELVETRPQALQDYDETIRLTLNSATSKSVEFRSGVRGWLIGITIFVDAVDNGDNMRVTLNGRDLKQNIQPRANFSIEEDFFEQVDMNDRIVLYYQSKGSTSKSIDFTPRVRFPRL